MLPECALFFAALSAQTLATALQAGHLTLLLNGWNEVSDEQRQRVSADLVSLVSQLAGASVVVTSRSAPKLKLPHPQLELRIQELNDPEIYHALKAAGIANLDNIFREIVSNSRIAQLARVPLFLWELAEAAQSKQSLPHTRLELLHRLVTRAAQEHEASLNITGVPDLTPRFLSALAYHMTDASVTVLSGVQACRICLHSHAATMRCNRSSCT